MKITNESQAALGGPWAQLGGDPTLGEGEVPIDCCDPGTDPPPDRAEDQSVFTVNAPVTGGIVQSKVGTFAGSVGAHTESFAATPTNGNTMVTFLIGTDTGGVIDTAGWSKIQEGTCNGDHVEIWTKVAGAAEPTGVHVTTESGSNVIHRLVLFEVAGSTDTSDHENDQPQASPLAGPSLTAAATGVLLSAFIGQVATYVGDPTWTPQGSLITDTFLRQSPGRLVSWVGHASVTAGAVNPSLTTTPLYAGTETANAAVIVGSTPTAAVWNVPAPNTVDDNDATYQEIDGEDVLRIDLGGPFRIVRSRLLVGAASAGSRSYQIAGANEADFSDLVTLASMSFVATGSFTADDLDIAWSTDQSYRYFQLTGSDEDRRVFSWELYEPDTSQGEDHTHDEIEAEIDALAAALDALDIPGVLSLPTVVAVGTSASGTGDVTPGLPTGHATDDILLLFVQSGNQGVTAPAGYAKLGPFAGFGTAAAAGSTRLTVFWKRDAGAESAPTVTDTGDHTLAQIMAVRGCVTSGDPFLNSGVRRKMTASTTGTAPGGATPIDDCLVVNAFAHALDSASSVFSAFTNADLGSVTEQIDVATADGNGGGIGVCTGTMERSGTFGNTTVTETSTTDVSVTFVMLPAGILGRAGFIDRQVFLTVAGSLSVADVWTKPTSAVSVYAVAIGSGSSGSAGRNAVTAAGGGGGGGGARMTNTLGANVLAATVNVTVAAGGAATANTDSAASNAGAASTFTGVTANGGLTAGLSANGSGGNGAAGGGLSSAVASGGNSFTTQPPGGGNGGTTGAAGGLSLGSPDASGGSGSGGGTTQASSSGGSSMLSGAGGGGGRANTTPGTGGSGSILAGNAGGATAGANGTDSTIPEIGGGGAAGGSSAAGPGGAGGWPGGGGGGGGSQSGAQRGGAGADGVVVVTTFCG